MAQEDEFNLANSFKWRRIAEPFTPGSAVYQDLVQVFALDDSLVCLFSFCCSPNISYAACQQLAESHYAAYVAGSIHGWQMPGAVPNQEIED